MRPFAKRSAEEANLLNPAFLASIILQCIKGYIETNKNGAPLVLPFLVVPLILHKHSRETLPRTVSTTLASWVTSTEGLQAKIGFAERARSLSPYIKEGVSLALANNLIKILPDGSINVGLNSKQRRQSSNDLTKEVEMCTKSANYCGRWFARTGKIEMIMVLMGVKP